jgi:hypothetical protein
MTERKRGAHTPATPLPWKWERSKRDPEYIPQGSFLGETMIALTDTYEGSDRDCTFVERAVNAFDPLVSALERLIDNVETGSYESTGQAVEEARAALSLAKDGTK